MKLSLNWCRRRFLAASFPGADRCADCHPRQGVRVRQDGVTRDRCSHSSRFGIERRRGDGAFDRDRRACLPSCWAPRPHRARAEYRERIGVVGVSKIPAYEYLKQESASALGVTEIGELPVVFVPMEGGWQLGLQTEALSDGLVSIFVPGAPNPHSGWSFSFPPTSFARPASSC